MGEQETPQPRNRGLPRLRRDLGTLGRLLSSRGKEPLFPQPVNVKPAEIVPAKPSALPIDHSEPLKVQQDVSVSIKINKTNPDVGEIKVGSVTAHVILEGDDLDIKLMMKYSSGLFVKDEVTRVGSEIIARQARQEIAADREAANENARRRLEEAGFNVKDMGAREYASCIRYTDLHPDMDPKALKELISEILPQVSKNQEESQGLVDEEHH